MDRIRITGGNRLNGTIPISGAKNAALPLMIASLLTDDTLTLDNVPRLSDVTALARILSNHGVDRSIPGKRVGQSAEMGQTLSLTARKIVDTCAPYELVSTMRASFWVIAPLLARMGEAKVSLPGGCAIGTRPVDFLLQAMEALGATIEIDGTTVPAVSGRAKVALAEGKTAFMRLEGMTFDSRLAVGASEAAGEGRARIGFFFGGHWRTWQQHARFDLDQHRGHQKIFGG